MPRCVTAVSDQLKEPKASRAEAGIVGLERQRFLLHLVFLGYLFCRRLSATALLRVDACPSVVSVLRDGTI